MEIINIKLNETRKEYCEKCGKPKFCEINGRYYPVMCDCEKEEYENEIRKRAEQEREKSFREQQALASIGDKYLDARFEKAEIGDFNKRAYDSCRNYCKFSKTALINNIGLYIYGENSTGKTYLTACMANELVRQGYSVLFTSMQKIGNAIKSTYHNVGENTQDVVMERLSRITFVFIDDLGKEFVGGKTSYNERLLLDIINARYNNGKPTIINSNYSIKELASNYDLDRAIIERIGEMSTKVISLTGHNFRRANYKSKEDIIKEMGL